MPFSVSPQMGVASEPEYVVGTARIGSRCSNAMAFASPMVEPPPMATQQSAFQPRRFRARGAHGIPRRVHQRLVIHRDGVRAEQLRAVFGRAAAARAWK